MLTKSSHSTSGDWGGSRCWKEDTELLRSSSRRTAGGRVMGGSTFLSSSVLMWEIWSSGSSTWIIFGTVGFGDMSCMIWKDRNQSELHIYRTVVWPCVFPWWWGWWCTDTGRSTSRTPAGRRVIVTLSHCHIVTLSHSPWGRRREPGRVFPGAPPGDCHTSASSSPSVVWTDKFQILGCFF